MPVPTGPGFCRQPSNKLCGYGPGRALGGVDLPVLACNNAAAEFAGGRALKLYTAPEDSDIFTT